MPQAPKFQTPSSSQEEQLASIGAQTFNFPREMFAQFVERVGSENLRVLISGDEVVGGMSAYQVGQWFGGRCIPMAGIALVCVAPEHRLSGASRQMLTSSLRELRERQVPLATLFASTQEPYRRVGFEQAGNSFLYEMPMTQIGRVKAPREWRKVNADDPQPFLALAEQRARITNGNLERTPGLWQRLFHPRENLNPSYAYVIDGADHPEGYIIYQQTGPAPDQPSRLHVRDMFATSRQAADGLWTFIGGHRSIFASVRWYGAMHDPLTLVTAECRPRILQAERWMLRIVDVAGALTQRGYGSHVSGQLDLEVHDDLLAENNGRHQLTVDAGNARVEPGGKGDLKIDIRGLAPLFSSFLSATSLSTMGWVSGTSDALGLADALFAGPEPWMPDRF